MNLQQKLQQLKERKDEEERIREVEELARFSKDVQESIDQTITHLQNLLVDDFKLIKPYLIKETIDNATEDHYPKLRMDYGKHSIWFWVTTSDQWSGDRMCLRCVFSNSNVNERIYTPEEFWNLLVNLIE